jgi:hypothetical protein
VLAGVTPYGHPRTRHDGGIRRGFLGIGARPSQEASEDALERARHGPRPWNPERR